MSGIMMLTDPGWVAFHKQHLFCVYPGKLPRNIVAVGRVQEQVELDQDAAWKSYGSALGASTEAEWRKQASRVLENSRKPYGGKIGY